MKWMKGDRKGGRKEREVETWRGDLRKGNGGDTGRNDEHKGVNVTKGNQFYQKHHQFSFTIVLIERKRGKFNLKRCFGREGVVAIGFRISPRRGIHCNFS